MSEVLNGNNNGTQLEAEIKGLPILKEIWKQHRGKCTALVVLAVVLLVSITLKIVYLFVFDDKYFQDNSKVYAVSDTANQMGKNNEAAFPFFTAWNQGFDRYVRELDIAGLLGGLVGILIGVYLTFIIERQNRKSQIASQAEMRELRQTVRKLEAASDNIESNVDSMLASITALVDRDNKFFPQETLDKVFEQIAEITDASIKNRTNLFVMNHSSSFGYLLSFKVKTVLNAIPNYKPENLDKLTLKDYNKAHETITQNQEKAFRCLTENSSKIREAKNNITYVTLDPIANGTESPYVKNYLAHIMKDAIVSYFVEFSNDTLEALKRLPPDELEKHYYIPQSMQPLIDSYGQNDLKKNFIKYLENKQIKDILKLQSDDIHVRTVAEIPIQVYLSDHAGGKGACLFMFVNHQTIGKSGHHLVAFGSRNEPYIINSFKSIIDHTH